MNITPTVKQLLIINIIFYIGSQVLGEQAYQLFSLYFFENDKLQIWQPLTHMFMHAQMPNIMHILFNMFALWMFGSVLEQVWGPKKFLLYYMVTGIGAAVIHYMVFYFQISPAVHSMDVFLASPNMATLQQFISTHQFNVGSAASDFNQVFENFNQSYKTLQMDPGNMQAMQESVNFVTAYREHFLNLPVVIGASGAIYGLLLAFGMLFPNSLIYVYFFIL